MVVIPDRQKRVHLLYRRGGVVNIKHWTVESFSIDVNLWAMLQPHCLRWKLEARQLKSGRTDRCTRFHRNWGEGGQECLCVCVCVCVCVGVCVRVCIYRVCASTTRDLIRAGEPPSSCRQTSLPSGSRHCLLLKEQNDLKRGRRNRLVLRATWSVNSIQFNSVYLYSPISQITNL